MVLNDPRALTRLSRGGPTTCHLYGAPWLQRVAINGKSDARGSGENKPKPLPWVATGCVRSSMVRRGSTVRVRQRALQRPRKAELFLSDEPLVLSEGPGVESVLGKTGWKLPPACPPWGARRQRS